MRNLVSTRASPEGLTVAPRQIPIGTETNLVIQVVFGNPVPGQEFISLLPYTPVLQRPVEREWPTEKGALKSYRPAIVGEPNAGRDASRSFARFVGGGRHGCRNLCCCRSISRLLQQRVVEYWVPVCFNQCLRLHPLRGMPHQVLGDSDNTQGIDG